jgi:flagellar biosynthesis protein FliQ
MSPEFVMVAAREMLIVVLTILTPLLLTAILTGIIVGLFQASTRINDMTLSFVPRFVAVLLALYFSASWVFAQLIDYVERSAMAAGILSR